MTTAAPPPPATSYPGQNADPNLVALGLRLRRALVMGDVAGVAACMAPEEPFGLHQGRTRTQYIAYEIDEFQQKAARFGLNADGPTVVVPWSHGRTVSVMFVNDEGWMLFENAFRLTPTPDGPRLAGNGVWASWQSKLRMTRVMDGDQVLDTHQERAVNIKPVNGASVINLVMLDRQVTNARQVGFEHDPLYGGTFLACQFDYEHDDLSTGWTRARVLGVDADGRRAFRTLEGDLRGADHPFFVPGQFPEVEHHRGVPWLVFSPASKPAEVMALGHDGAYQQWKYPEERALRLAGPPQEIVVSDHIGHDWALRWPRKGPAR